MKRHPVKRYRTDIALSWLRWQNVMYLLMQQLQIKWPLTYTNLIIYNSVAVYNSNKLFRGEMNLAALLMDERDWQFPQGLSTFYESYSMGKQSVKIPSKWQNYRVESSVIKCCSRIFTHRINCLQNFGPPLHPCRLTLLFVKLYRF